LRAVPILDSVGVRAQVDEHALHALLEAALNQLLELLGGTAGDQALLWRQQQFARIIPLRQQPSHL
jgi:hypothetical protein